MTRPWAALAKAWELAVKYANRGEWLDLVWLLFRSQLDIDYPQYDVSYDVRDRARLVNTILFSDGAPNIKDRAVDVFLSSKPAPKFADAAGIIWRCCFAEMNFKQVAKAVQSKPVCMGLLIQPSCRSWA
jgi:hypothetical protein